MSLLSHVPADVEPESFIDLCDDCREVSGVLAPYVPGTIRLPEARHPLSVEISPETADGLAGWGDYGS